MQLLLLLLELTLLATTISADVPLPHKFEFTEAHEHYHMLAVLDAKDGTQLKGFRVFNDRDRLLQFIGFEQDLSQKVPEFVRGEIPGASPVKFVDCNFDGFVDAMFREDISPRYESFEIWLWDPQKKKFVVAQQLNDAEINAVDPRTKAVSSGGSGGHGDFWEKAYKYSPSGKLVLAYTDFISGRENSEVKTYYADGKVSKIVKSVAPADDQ